MQKTSRLPNLLLKIHHDNIMLEDAYLVSDFYHAIRKNTHLPNKSFPPLEIALRAQRHLREYINKCNVGINQGLKLINSSLTDEQVVMVWLLLQKRSVRGNSSDVPAITLGHHQLFITNK